MIENVYDFLNQSLRNQKKNCIITDLKSEYRVAIDKLQIKQQFCTFHTKQLINREIRDHIDKTEYRVAIDRLQIKQQFCTFHTKQLINREIRDYIGKNNASEE